MSAPKVSIIVFALCASVCAVQAAGGIKGNPQRADSSIKSPFARQPVQPQQQQQQYLPPPQQVLAPAPPQPQAPVKGPVFSAARVAPAQQQQQIVQQQQEIVQQQVQEAPVVQQQQQQEEIDPNAAAQEGNGALIAPAPGGAAAAAAAASEEEANPKPEPYAFQYAFEAGDSATSGSSQREEQQDANGRVTGFYTLKGEDGRDRRVDYVADASGFRATISTNEMGTALKDSADVVWNAQSPSDGQLRAAESATQAARQRALASPQAAGSSSQLSSSNGQKNISSPRQNVAGAGAGAASSTRLSKANFQQAQQQQAQIANTQQLQEPFEQIRQVELNGRARKSRHAPFYLYTI